MHIYKATTTLDGHLPPLQYTSDKSRAQVLLVGGKKFDLAEFPDLRGIFKTGVGRDNIPEAEALARGIRCGFPSAATAAIIHEETASFAASLILRCLYAEIGDFAAWKKTERSMLASRVLLVLGVGNIGSRVVAKMKSFLRVLSYDVLANQPDELEALMRQADCVTLHLPLTSSTRGLIDATKLAWMRTGSTLVNTARAALVNEDHLFDELAAGRLRAACDVFWQEPYRGKLMKFAPERFVVSPHVASTCREFIAGTADDFQAFLRELEEQKRPA